MLSIGLFGRRETIIPLAALAMSEWVFIRAFCEYPISTELSCAGSHIVSLNIFYCQILYSNGAGAHALTTLVTTLPMQFIHT